MESSAVDNECVESTAGHLAKAISSLEKSFSTSAQALVQNLQSSLGTISELSGLLEQFLIGSLQVSLEPAGQPRQPNICLTNNSPYPITARLTVSGPVVREVTLTVDGLGRVVEQLQLPTEGGSGEWAGGDEVEEMLFEVVLSVVSPGSGRVLQKSTRLHYGPAWQLQPGSTPTTHKDQTITVEVPVEPLRRLLALPPALGVAGWYSLGSLVLHTDGGPGSSVPCTLSADNPRFLDTLAQHLPYL